MALYTIYSGSADHQVQSVSTVYATARSGGSRYNDAAGSFGFVGQLFSTPNYTCEQLFFEFNTSAVPAGTPLANVTLTFTVERASISPSSITVNVGEKTLVGGISDWVAGASLSGITDFGNISVGSTGAKTVTGLANIARSATYGLMLWSARHEASTNPTNDERVSIYNSRSSGTTNDPYLTMNIPVAYTMAASVGTFTLTGQDIKNLRVIAAPATFTLTGIDTPLRYGKVMQAAVGTFTLTGHDVDFPVLRDPPLTRTIVFDLSTLDDTRTLAL